MKPSQQVSQQPDSKTKSYLCSLFVIASLVFGVYVTRRRLFAEDYRISLGLGTNGSQLKAQSDDFQALPRLKIEVNDTIEDKFNHTEEKLSNNCQDLPRLKIEANDTREDKFNHTEDELSNKCQKSCRPLGSEALPEGIVVKSSNLEMRPLWGSVTENEMKKSSSLLALSVGIKQKILVNEIVRKFLGNSFAVMLFHYDNVMDEWNDFEWSSRVIHVSAANQTKWWFAKRFLHPDIVADYDYIFLWDEDLGIENFDPERYLTIIKEEGLEISQPALDPAKSEVHHMITVRNRRSKVHRRLYRGKCKENSTDPPCAGWVEMMAPVFSKAAWRCAWYMIQNDLIHAWGLDMKLGYCAQGDRSRKVGVVDSEYVVHMGLPTLGGLSGEHKLTDESADLSSTTKPADVSTKLADSDTSTTPVLKKIDNRYEVRKQSYIEMKSFNNRWTKAVKDDQCWIDPYQETEQQKVR